MRNHKDLNQKSGKALLGFLLLFFGSLLLIRSLNLFFLPGYLFSLPMWFILIGLFIGFRKGFDKKGALIFLGLGGVFMAHRILNNFDMHQFFWPAVIIGLGIWLIMKPSRTHTRPPVGEWDKRVDTENQGPSEASGQEQSTHTDFNNLNVEDRLNTVSAFGGVKKTIVSKNFRGGEVMNFFGGSEINLTQADIHGIVKLDITQVFGGTKIIVPANWTVYSDTVAIFGGIEDKRPPHTPDPEKVLIIDGTSVFGGIDIRSF